VQRYGVSKDLPNKIENKENKHGFDPFSWKIYPAEGRFSRWSRIKVLLLDFEGHFHVEKAPRCVVSGGINLSVSL
jgi:hypothetical protein